MGERLFTEMDRNFLTIYILREMKVYKSIMIIKNHILEFYRIASFLFTFQVLLVKLIFEMCYG